MFVNFKYMIFRFSKKKVVIFQIDDILLTIELSVYDCESNISRILAKKDFSE